MSSWRLGDIFPDGERNRLTESLKSETESFKGLRERLPLSADEFIQAIAQEERMSEIAGRLASKTGLRLSEDTTDAARVADEASLSQLSCDVENATLFFSVWFRDLPDDKAAMYMEAAGRHRYLLERIRAWRSHTLGENEERIINLKDTTGSEAAVRLYDAVTGRYRFRFRGRLLTYDEVSEYKLSRRRRDRVEAYESTLGVYGADETVLGEIYRAVAQDTVNETVKLRNFKRPLSAANLANDVPDEAVESLLSSVKANRSLFQKYFQLKAGLSRIRRFDRYDVYAPYVREDGRYGYGEAVKKTLSVFRDFDEGAYRMAKRIFDERHVNPYPAARKQPGAFCHSVVLGVTPYLMLNHTGSLTDLYTMVHETGHAVHTMAAHAQTQLTYHAGLPLAETASVFAEMLLTRKLMADAEDDSEKASLLVRSLDRQYATVARQAYFTIFEVDAHDALSEGASAPDLSRLYMRNLREQFGRGIKIPESFRHEWLGIQHIYYSPFYCYTYAFANMVALALYERYEEEGGKFTPTYMRILSKGGSESPMRIMSDAGLDYCKRGFWDDGFKLIKKELETLKSLAKKNR